MCRQVQPAGLGHAQQYPGDGIDFGGAAREHVLQHARAVGRRGRGDGMDTGVSGGLVDGEALRMQHRPGLADEGVEQDTVRS